MKVRALCTSQNRQLPCCCDIIASYPSSKGVTGGLDVLDGGGVEGGKRADAGGGVLPMETGVRTSVQISGDGEVLSAEISSALPAEERPDRY